jgi:hypothetical protein
MYREYKLYWDDEKGVFVRLERGRSIYRRKTLLKAKERRNKEVNKK